MSSSRSRSLYPSNNRQNKIRQISVSVSKRAHTPTSWGRNSQFFSLKNNCSFLLNWLHQDSGSRRSEVHIRIQTKSIQITTNKFIAPEKQHDQPPNSGITRDRDRETHRSESKARAREAASVRMEATRSASVWVLVRELRKPMRRRARVREAALWSRWRARSAAKRSERSRFRFSSTSLLQFFNEILPSSPSPSFLSSSAISFSPPLPSPTPSSFYRARLDGAGFCLWHQNDGNTPTRQRKF